VLSTDGCRGSVSILLCSGFCICRYSLGLELAS
jgi:hypothetical protein